MNNMNWLVAYPQIALLSFACVVALVDLWVTDPQRKRIFAIAHEVGCPMNTVGTIVQSFGFDIAANITQEKYDAVVQAVRDQFSQPALSSSVFRRNLVVSGVDRFEWITSIDQLAHAAQPGLRRQHQRDHHAQGPGRAGPAHQPGCDQI